MCFVSRNAASQIRIQLCVFDETAISSFPAPRIHSYTSKNHPVMAGKESCGTPARTVSLTHFQQTTSTDLTIPVVKAITNQAQVPPALSSVVMGLCTNSSMKPSIEQNSIQCFRGS
ncbi:hypothetical protein KC333_g57 [Hortaea werneckii]|nr:hypothetical protein KC333_g57 [Hortaea werneckii]